MVIINKIMTNILINQFNSLSNIPNSSTYLFDKLLFDFID
jgi:hypothetical protein